MNRREFMKIAAAIAGGLGIPDSKVIPVPGMNYSQARDAIKHQIKVGMFKVTAGERIRDGALVYIADDGLAYVPDDLWDSRIIGQCINIT